MLSGLVYACLSGPAAHNIGRLTGGIEINICVENTASVVFSQPIYNKRKCFLAEGVPWVMGSLQGFVGELVIRFPR